MSTLTTQSTTSRASVISTLFFVVLAIYLLTSLFGSTQYICEELPVPSQGWECAAAIHTPLYTAVYFAYQAIEIVSPFILLVLLVKMILGNIAKTQAEKTQRRWLLVALEVVLSLMALGMIGIIIMDKISRGTRGM